MFFLFYFVFPDSRIFSTHVFSLPQTTFTSNTLSELRAVCKAMKVELRTSSEDLLALAPVSRCGPM